MPHIILPPSWRLPERDATPEHVFWNRRRFLQQLGLGAVGIAGGLLAGCTDNSARAVPTDAGGMPPTPPPSGVPADVLGRFPAPRNAAFTLDRPVTEERLAARYNNFYEFTTQKSGVWKLAESFQSRPWTVEVTGLVNRPQTFDVDDLIRTLPMEERLYRFRCVEAWAMAVPWTGIPFRELAKRVEPTNAARYVRFITFLRPEEAPGQRLQRHYPWPYFEGLRMDEAMNELTMLVTGVYGKPLPNQHGAPIRLIVPWKYGFKNIKSIVRIEFTAERPPTFWNTLQPREYSFLANVNPEVPHPRWSQATERVLGSGDRVPTRQYNGYGEQVAHLYTT